ncbi:MAG TPA: hypothetical protein DEP84_28105 [Chloroflexi bacterium]|nr:hypothetical protein [Chloroflexota bacterium]
MSVHVLTEQATDPTLRLLAAYTDLVPVPIDEASRRSGLDHPLVILGTVIESLMADMAGICQRAHKKGYPLLLLPPWPARANLTPVLDTPAHLVVQPGRGDQIHLIDAYLRQALAQDMVQVRCDQVLATPLTAGIMAFNDTGQPVLFRYRPSNTTTPIYVTTIQLLTLSSRSDPLARERLLRALLSLLDAPQPTKEGVGAANQEILSPSSDELRAVVLALTLARTTSLLGLQQLLIEQLYIELSPERIQVTLQHLAEADCVAESDGAYQVNQAELERWIARLGLHPYVRELNRV